MKIKLILTLTISFQCFVLFGQTSYDSLTYWLNKVAAQQRVQGFAVAIFDQGKLLYAKGFGYADAATKRAYKPQTVQPIGSISKAILGVALMKAQEMGKLKLSDDINKYLPFRVVNPYIRKQKITIKHLASHTSGILDSKYYYRNYLFPKKMELVHDGVPRDLKRQRKVFFKQANKSVGMPLYDFMKQTYQVKGKWYSKKNFKKVQLGYHYYYSNANASLAGMILEKATGIPYKKFVQKYIFNPLKMTNTKWSMAEYSKEEKSVLYMSQDALPPYKSITYADGGIVTNAFDLSKFFQAALQGYLKKDNIIKAYNWNLLWQPVSYLGYGLFWERFGGAYGHSGSYPGVSTFASFDEEEKKGIILLFNNNETPRTCNQVFRIVSYYFAK